MLHVPVVCVEGYNVEVRKGDKDTENFRNTEKRKEGLGQEENILH